LAKLCVLFLSFLGKSYYPFFSTFSFLVRRFVRNLYEL
jgi:hypothetical protein